MNTFKRGQKVRRTGPSVPGEPGVCDPVVQGQIYIVESFNEENYEGEVTLAGVHYYYDSWPGDGYRHFSVSKFELVSA